jgi:hypothetical protein
MVHGEQSIASIWPHPSKFQTWKSNERDAAVCVSAVAAAAIISFFWPQGGLLCGLFACMLCAARLRPLLPLALLVFAHAGSTVVTSRDLNGEASDFATYFDLFSGICSNMVSTEDSLFTFGPEFGLASAYLLISIVGGCGLSIYGLAYVQTVLVSFTMLALLCAHGVRGRGSIQAALIVGGTLALFSFIYVTQLSRQAISSAFVLAALLGNGQRGKVAALVAMATAFHLTAPVIYGLAVILRSPSRASIMTGTVLIGAFLAVGTELLAWALEHAESFVGVGKLAYHFAETELEETVRSDERALLLLIAAGLVSVPFLRRIPRESLRDARVLWGFALLAWVLLPLPLAATRLTLAFSAIAIGYFLFKPLAVASPRLALLVLFACIVYRSGVLSLFDPPDQTLWYAFPSSSIYPLYYFESF